MPFANTRDHKLAIQRALNVIFDVMKTRETDFVRDFRVALGGNQIPGVTQTLLPDGVSRQTIRNWRTASPDKDWSYPRAKAVFNFLETSSRYQTEHINQLGLNAGSDSTAFLVYNIGAFLKNDRTPRYSFLYDLQGQPFAMFRESWSKLGSNQYIRSIVRFRKKNDIILFHEIQNYEYIDDKVSIYEEDEEFVFNYGSNIVIFSREIHGLGVKFLVAHDFHPNLGGRSGVQIIKGNLTGVYGSGPHRQYRFIMRRIKDHDLESRVLLDTDLDSITLSYLKDGN